MRTMAVVSKKVVASLFSVLLLVIFVVAVVRVEKSETAKLRFDSLLDFLLFLFSILKIALFFLAFRLESI